MNENHIRWMDVVLRLNLGWVHAMIIRSPDGDTCGRHCRQTGSALFQVPKRANGLNPHCSMSMVLALSKVVRTWSQRNDYQLNLRRSANASDQFSINDSSLIFHRPIIAETVLLSLRHIDGGSAPLAT